MKLWIARDKYGDLFIFTNEPLWCGNECWCDSKNGDFMLINKNSFPEVTFDNSPVQVELKLVEK
jgi:hypothetical protein